MAKRPDLTDIDVGRRVRALRLERGMSQEKLACALDLTFQQVQKYEKGTNRIGAGRLQRIAGILEVPVSTFFDRSEKLHSHGIDLRAGRIGRPPSACCAPIHAFQAPSAPAEP